MIWKLFQLSVFGAVISSNIEWKWTENGYAAAIIGLIAAGMATQILTAIFGLYSRSHSSIRGE